MHEFLSEATETIINVEFEHTGGRNIVQAVFISMRNFNAHRVK